MKNLRLASGAVVVLVLGLLLAFQAKSHSSGSACGPYRADKTITIDSQKLIAEVARSVQARNQGLGGRPCIGRNQAMLFVFDKPAVYSMWMKDMKFSIDIVWISSDHKTAAVEQDIAPSTYPDSFLNKDNPAQYVLEIQADRSKSLGLKLGTPINF